VEFSFVNRITFAKSLSKIFILVETVSLMIFRNLHKFGQFYFVHDDFCFVHYSSYLFAKCTVASKKKTGRQNHALTQWKMLHCKTVVNIII
jgi:hypothetical protein